MDQAQSPIVDFHSHFVGPSLPLTTLKGLCGPQRAAWERINARLTDAGALLASLEQGGIAARIISSPPEFIEDAGGNVPQDGYRRVNDAVADLVGKHPGRLYGLASVDAYGGYRAPANSSAASGNLGCAAFSCPAPKVICCRMQRQHDRRLPLPPLCKYRCFCIPSPTGSCSRGSSGLARSACG